jgi:signal transduction histidine kinase
MPASSPIKVPRGAAARIRHGRCHWTRHLTVSQAGGPDGAWGAGNEDVIRRMVDNVLDNAIIHNDSGGWIQISAACDGAAVCLVVESGGDVLDPERIRELGQPFRRIGADCTGSGAGLALSIVAAIATAHRGTLELAARPGGGLRAGIGLPAA